MLTAAWKNKAVAALLYAVLFVVSAPCAHAAEVLDSALLQKLFPSARRVEDARRLAGIVFRTANCPCYALVDDRLIVRHILVFPPEKGAKSRKGVSKTRTTAEQLAAFLTQHYGKVKLHSFSVQESGYVISITPPRAYASVVKRSALGLRTSSLISRLIDGHEGTFHRCDGGELAIKVSGSSVENDFCHISFSLFKCDADVIGFVPGRYMRRSDEKVVMAAVSILDLPDPYSPLYYRYNTKIKEIRSSTGATKCIGFDDEWAMVSYRRQYYIGAELHLRDFIRNKKRSGYAGKFDFPQQSDNIPSIEDKEDAPKEKEIAQVTPPAAAEDKSGGITVEQICDYFGCHYPVEKEGCACLRFDNCRIVIPLPDASHANGQSPLRLPIQALYVRTPEGGVGSRPSQRHALFLSFMLMQSASDASTVGVHPTDNTISLLKFPNGIAPGEPKEEEVKKLLHAGNFPDTYIHPWPEQSRAGEPIRSDWKTLITPKPDAALKIYMEYLKRLME